MRKALIVGSAGPTLSPDETAFLRDMRPAGYILFARNVETAQQVTALTEAVRAAIGADDVLILIDQEGGRVQRLRPPVGRALPPAAAYGALYARDPEAAKTAAHAAARLLADDLRTLGINCNCAPVVDVPVAGAHAIIGDRAYGTTVAQVAELARSVADGFLAGGILPVIKHIPGHGRADADSHHALPTVPTAHAELSATDFAAFRAVADLPVAMTAHVVFSEIDARSPASTSAKVTQDIMRGEIGFDGLLMSDDLSMKALSGPLEDRAQNVIAAGSDIVLHCNGDMSEMIAAAAGTPKLTGRAADRFARAISAPAVAEALDPEAVVAAERIIAEVLAEGGV